MAETKNYIIYLSITLTIIALYFISFWKTRTSSDERNVYMASPSSPFITPKKTVSQKPKAKKKPQPFEETSPETSPKETSSKAFKKGPDEPETSKVPPKEKSAEIPSKKKSAEIPPESSEVPPPKESSEVPPPKESSEVPPPKEKILLPANLQKIPINRKFFCKFVNQFDVFPSNAYINVFYQFLSGKVIGDKSYLDYIENDDTIPESGEFVAQAYNYIVYDFIPEYDARTENSKCTESVAQTIQDKYKYSGKIDWEQFKKIDQKYLRELIFKCYPGLKSLFIIENEW